MTFVRDEAGHVVDFERNLQLSLSMGGYSISEHYFHSIGKKESGLGGRFRLTKEIRKANSADLANLDSVAVYTVTGVDFSSHEPHLGGRVINGYTRAETLEIIREALDLRATHRYRSPELIEKSKKIGKEIIFTDATLAWAEGEE